MHNVFKMHTFNLFFHNHRLSKLFPSLVVYYQQMPREEKIILLENIYFHLHIIPPFLTSRLHSAQCLFQRYTIFLNTSMVQDNSNCNFQSHFQSFLAIQRTIPKNYLYPCSIQSMLQKAIYSKAVRVTLENHDLLETNE